LNGKIPVVILLGPTACGKTALLLEICGNGDAPAPVEVISADSMQVYRGIDIGTAKPGPEERAALAHHLIDLLEPDEQFNAGAFVRLADECCAAVYARGGLPVVAGGTGFYLKNFMRGLPDSPPGSEAIRRVLKRECEENGAAFLYAALRENDPAAASAIHSGDTYRIIRALEVIRLTGKPFSAFEAENAEKKKAREAMYDFLVIGLTRKREDIYARINARVDAMFARGLEREVRTLFEKGYTPSDPGMRAIGYREFFIAGEDDCPALKPRYTLSSDTGHVRELIQQNSRHYAKRQETFFKKMDPIRWCTIDRNEDEARKMLRGQMKAFWETRHA
jgi:tRNA dimethylallyltransferase